MKSCIIFIYLFLINCLNGEKVVVKINSTTIINIIDEKFISICLDQSLLSYDEVLNYKFNFSSTRLKTLMKGLAPAYLRFGGSPANWQFFNAPVKKLNHTSLTKFVALKKRFLIRLLRLISENKYRLVLDLNSQTRLGLQWDPLNTVNLLKFISESGFGHLVDFELGNEPVYVDLIVTPNQLGEDYVSLSMLIKDYPQLKHSSVVGPAIVEPNKGSKYMRAVINAMKGTLKAATFHHYYFRGDTASYKDYINPIYFDNLRDEIIFLKKTINETDYKSTPLWIGESSDSWHSGTPNVSDRFVSGFLWLDKLGLGAQLGIKVIMRQTFFGLSYSLLDNLFYPNPDYWLTWLHHKLVGDKVIYINANCTNTFRIYAHCTKISYLNKRGLITTFALNMHPTEQFEIVFKAPYSDVYKHFFLLEPYAENFEEDIPILSKKVKLNGKLLTMINDSTMPEISPLILAHNINPILPPLTFAFIVIPDSQLSC